MDIPDASNAVVGSFSESLSKTIEMSYLLRSRSPWIAVETSSTTAIVEQRDRSISFASMPSIHGSFYDGGFASGTYSFSGRGQAGEGVYMESEFDANNQDHQFLLPLQHDSHDGSRRSHRSQKSTLGFYEKDLHLSTLSQSVFNCTNSLMGVGLLSLPYTLRVCGWLGIVVLLFFAAITHHTGKLLGRIMDYTPKTRLRDGPGAFTMYGFHDMGYAAFGKVRPPPVRPRFAAFSEYATPTHCSTHSRRRFPAETA